MSPALSARQPIRQEWFPLPVPQLRVRVEGRAAHPRRTVMTADSHCPTCKRPRPTKPAPHCKTSTTCNWWTCTCGATDTPQGLTNGHNWKDNP